MGFAALLVMAALPRQEPIAVVKIVGMEIPKSVRKKIFHDLVVAG